MASSAYEGFHTLRRCRAGCGSCMIARQRLGTRAGAPEAGDPNIPRKDKRALRQSKGEWPRERALRSGSSSRRSEDVAGLHFTRLKPDRQPTCSLLRGAVRERLGSRGTTGLPHESVITDRSRGSQPLFEISIVQKRHSAHALLPLGPIPPALRVGTSPGIMYGPGTGV